MHQVRGTRIAKDSLVEAVDVTLLADSARRGGRSTDLTDDRTAGRARPCTCMVRPERTAHLYVVRPMHGTITPL